MKATTGEKLDNIVTRCNRGIDNTSQLWYFGFDKDTFAFCQSKLWTTEGSQRWLKAVDEDPAGVWLGTVQP
jgi:hypothetical protein